MRKAVFAKIKSVGTQPSKNHKECMFSTVLSVSTFVQDVSHEKGTVQTHLPSP